MSFSLNAGRHRSDPRASVNPNARPLTATIAAIDDIQQRRTAARHGGPRIAMRHEEPRRRASVGRARKQAKARAVVRVVSTACRGRVLRDRSRHVRFELQRHAKRGDRRPDLCAKGAGVLFEELREVMGARDRVVPPLRIRTALTSA
ncbi:MAG: hypothetical protein QOI02_511 [Actinomycetota bacterium]|nr:hypothetical protein [Actinomycetota bacterium]